MQYKQSLTATCWTILTLVNVEFGSIFAIPEPKECRGRQQSILGKVSRQWWATKSVGREMPKAQENQAERELRQLFTVLRFLVQSATLIDCRLLDRKSSFASRLQKLNRLFGKLLQRNCLQSYDELELLNRNSRRHSMKLNTLKIDALEVIMT